MFVLAGPWIFACVSEVAGAAGCTVFVLRAIVAVVLVDALGVMTVCRQELDDGGAVG